MQNKLGVVGHKILQPGGETRALEGETVGFTMNSF